MLLQFRNIKQSIAWQRKSKESKEITTKGKIEKLEVDFKNNDSHSLSESVCEREGKTEISFMVAKNHKVNKRR